LSAPCRFRILKPPACHRFQISSRWPAEICLGPDEEADRYGGLLDRYHSRPHREKEHFAHAYAERLREHLEAIRAIPFDRELDREQVKQDGLRLEDFHPS
jgi:hypothetical protein